ncbi:MAG: hypothetical protein WBS22_03240, partial [Methylocystis sp.]
YLRRKAQFIGIRGTTFLKKFASKYAISIAYRRMNRVHCLSRVRFHTFLRPAMAEPSASSLAAGQSRIIAAEGEMGPAGPNPLPTPSAA